MCFKKKVQTKNLNKTSNTALTILTDNIDIRKLSITGGRDYVDIGYKNNIIRFSGELCLNSFHAEIYNYRWIQRVGKIDGTVFSNIIMAVHVSNMESKFKIIFVNSDGSEFE